MQFARWGGSVGAMLAIAVIAATAAVAAQGDALLVTGNNVNVRAGPSTDAGILARVGIDEPATELRRLGPWVEVTLPDQDVLGWIHGSLLTNAPLPAGAENQQAPAPSPLAVAAVDPAPMSSPDPAASVPVAGPAERPATVAAVSPAAEAEADPSTPLGQFRSEVEHFNDRAVAAAGVDLFTGVKPLGESGVQVVTTDAWAIMSLPGQRSYLNALYGRWQAVSGGGEDLRLQIIDSHGALMMERSGP